MRRRWLCLTVLLAATACGEQTPETPVKRPAPSPTATATASATPASAGAFRRLERRFGARLGVYALDTGSGREVAHRADARFPFASTFKALAAAAMLHEYGLDELGERVPITGLVNAYSPITEKRVGASMTLEELCDAAVRHSDNTAANLLLERLGGPKGLDRLLEDVAGDDVTRMERPEPDLNVWAPGQTRDTSTPRALARDLEAFVVADTLPGPERRQLVKWLRTNTTGDALIRAGVPGDWKVGDKTGTGATYGARNDIAVVWPPGGAPIVVAILTTRTRADAEPDDELLARAAAVVVEALAPGGADG